MNIFVLFIGTYIIMIWDILSLLDNCFQELKIFVLIRICLSILECILTAVLYKYLTDDNHRVIRISAQIINLSSYGFNFWGICLFRSEKWATTFTVEDESTCISDQKMRMKLGDKMTLFILTLILQMIAAGFLCVLCLIYQVIKAIIFIDYR